MNVTDNWVLAKKPGVVIKCVGSMSDASKVRQSLRARFPSQDIVIITSDALGSDSYGLYARIALAKHLYGDWYTDVDLSVVAQELGVSRGHIAF